jgi:hypothetical protein
MQRITIVQGTLEVHSLHVGMHDGMHDGIHDSSMIYRELNTSTGFFKNPLTPAIYV